MRPSLFILLSLLLIAFAPIPSPAQTTCPPGFDGYAPPRLEIGGRGQVLPGPSNRLRSAPNTSGAVVGSLEAATPFAVLDGPSCTNGIVWWQVELDGLTGWTAESVDGNYFIEPLLPPTPTPPPPRGTLQLNLNDALTTPDTALATAAVHIAFTGGETLLVAATSQPFFAELWDLATERSFELALGPQDAPIIFYAENLQPDGQGGDTIVSGDVQGRVFIWDPFFSTYTEKPITADLALTYFPAYAASAPADFRYVVVGGCLKASPKSGCTVGGAEVHDISRRDESRIMLAFTVSGHTDTVNAVALSPDNTVLLTGGADGRVILWDTTSGKPTTEIKPLPTGEITALATAPDGATFAVGLCTSYALTGLCEVGDVAIYNIDGQLRWQQPALPGDVAALDYDADGSRLVIGGGALARVFNVPDGAPLQTIQPEGYTNIADVRFFNLSNRVAVVGASEIGIFSLE